MNTPEGISVTTKLVCHLNEKEYAACHRLTYRKKGCLRHELEANRTRGWTQSFVAMVRDSSGKVLSWGLFSDITSHRDLPNVQLWTATRHRRSGYGTLVMEAIKERLKGKPFRVIPHDTPSTNFFERTAKWSHLPRMHQPSNATPTATSLTATM